MKVERRGRHWKHAEDERLRAMWGHEPMRRIAECLDRTVFGVYSRAVSLGVTLGCPQGLEYLSAAAARTGYTIRQLRRILKWGAVRTMVSYGKPLPGRQRYHRRIVDPLDVDEAIARFLKTETIRAAAERHGMTWPQMARWIEAAGVQVKYVPTDPKHPLREGGRMHRRVESDVVDRVVRERRAALASTESLAEAAARTGIHWQTLRTWLERAGIDRPGHERVERAVINEVVRTQTSRENLTAAARRLKVAPRILHRWIRQAGLELRHCERREPAFFDEIAKPRMPTLRRCRRRGPRAVHARAA